MSITINSQTFEAYENNYNDPNFKEYILNEKAEKRKALCRLCKSQDEALTKYDEWLKQQFEDYKVNKEYEQ